MQSLKDMVKGRVEFTRYYKGDLWYVTEGGFNFPVAISDTGDAEFLGEDKALLFMRWIRKHRDECASAQNDILFGQSDY